MAGDIANPRIWVEGDVYVAPTGTTAPTDVTTALDAAFVALGLLSQDDGITERRSEDRTDHYAYGNILVRTTRTKHKREVKVTALEDTPVVHDLANPGSTAVTDTAPDPDLTTRTVKVPNTPNPKAWVVQNADGAVGRRLYIPTIEVVEIGDRQTSDNQIATVELTANIYPDGNGVLYYEITNDPQAVVAP